MSEKYVAFFEMAFPKQNIIMKMINVQPLILEHIIKLLLYPENIRDHRLWTNSIYKQILAISDMKWEGNNKFLKQKDYYDYLFTKPLENGDNYQYLDKMVGRVISVTKKLYKKTTLKKYDKEAWINLLQKFYIEVSKHLSQGETNLEKYTDLIKKYFLPKKST